MEVNNFFKQHDFSDDIPAEISRAFKREVFPKNYHLLLPGNHSKKIFFFEKGFARTYYYKNGKDITQYFYKENDSFAPIESIFHNRPSHYGLELLEDSVIYSIKYPSIAKYLNGSIEVNKLFRMITVTQLAFYDRLESILFHSARERYERLLRDHPDILLRAPLGHIASYLGITQQTLSVIRARTYRQELPKKVD